MKNIDDISFTEFIERKSEKINKILHIKIYFGN